MRLLGICKCQVHLGVHVNDIAILAFLVLGLKAKGSVSEEGRIMV